MIVNRTEQQVIHKSHPLWKIVDEYSFRAKNMYNFANYIVRQKFIQDGEWIRAYDVQKICQPEDCYKSVGSQAAQKIIQVLDKNWKSFFVAIKDWKRNPSKYLGRPKLPKYLDKNGRCTFYLKNIQCSLKDNVFRISFKPFNQYTVRTNACGKLLQCRFVPRGSHYVMEIVYQIEVPNITEQSENIASIDLGVDNFITMVNNIGLKPIVVKGGVIKSINQYYNKKKAKLQSELMKVNKQHWSKQLQKLTDDRYEKIEYQMHCISKRVVDYCVMYGIDTLIVGRNKGWKQENEGMQNFTYIPYEMFENMIQYKCENNGIKCILVDESYTSGTSFLDNEQPCKENYDKSRRVHRGLFVSNNGTKINADVNGAYQILKKVIPNAFAEGIEGVGLHPTVIQMGNREWIDNIQ